MQSKQMKGNNKFHCGNQLDRKQNKTKTNRKKGVINLPCVERRPLNTATPPPSKKKKKKATSKPFA